MLLLKKIYYPNYTKTIDDSFIFENNARPKGNHKNRTPRADMFVYI